MNKFTLLLLLALSACVSQEQLVQGRAKTLSYAEGVCQGRDFAPGSPEYLKCVQEVGNRFGYKLVSDGELAFIVPPLQGGMGPIGGGTYYPPVNVPSVYNNPN